MVETFDIAEALRAITAKVCSWSIEVNPHRAVYETVDYHLQRAEADDDEIAPEVRAECVRRDQLVWLQCYPYTPVGFWRVYHWDTAECVKAATQRMFGGGNG